MITKSYNKISKKKLVAKKLLVCLFSGLTLVACSDLAETEQDRDDSSTELLGQLIEAEANSSSADAEPVDSEQILRGLIEGEKQERIKADRILNEKIDALAEELAVFKSEMLLEIKRLDESDASLQTQITDNETAFSARMDQMEETWGEELRNSISTLESEILSEMTDRFEQSDSRQAAARLVLQNQMDSKFSQMSETIKAKYQELVTSIKTLERDHHNKMTELVQNATNKAEVELQLEIENLKNAQNAERKALQDQLTGLIDDTNADVRNEVARLDQEIADLNTQAAKNKAQLEKKIRQQGVALRQLISKSISDLDQKLSENQERALAPIRGQIADLNSKIDTSIQQVTDNHNESQRLLRNEMLSLMADAREDIRNKFETVSNRLSNLSTKFVNARANLNRKIEEARIEAQNALQSEKTLRFATVAQLEQSLAELEAQQTNERATLESELKDLIEQNDAASIDRYNELQLQLVNLDSETATRFSEVGSEIFQNRVAADAELKALKQKLAQTDNEIYKLAIEQAEFRAEVANTYATKEALTSVFEYTQSVFDITKQLGRQIDENDEQMKKYLSGEFKNVRDELKNKIADVKASVKDLREDFTDHVRDYRSEMKDLKSEFNGLLKDARSDLLTTIRITNQSTRDDLTDKMRSVAVRFESMSQTMKESFSSKIDDVEYKLKTQIATNASEIEQAKIKAQQELNTAIAEEQNHRQKMQEALNDLTRSLAEVAETAKRGEKLAQRNSQEVAKLYNKFEEEKERVTEKFKVAKEDVEAKLAAMKDDYKERISVVSARAKEAVKNLGEDVQKNFAATATQIADLQQSQAATNTMMTNYINDVTANELAKKRLEMDIKKPKEDTVDALFNVLSSLGEMELAFVKAINPTQDNLPFYDNTFKPIMAKCDGNVDATFANALGYDSFQLLAQEYSRLLALYGKSTRGTGIFFGLDKASSGDNLHNLTLSSALRHTSGSETESCLADIQAWARHILVSSTNDKNIIDLRKKLSSNAAFARSVNKFHAYASAMKAPADNMENVIKASVKSDLDPNDVLFGDEHGLAYKYALALLDATHMQSQINDRKSSYDSIVRAQEKATEDNSEMAAEFAAHKNEISNLLDGFKQDTNARINNLENKVGNLDDSMKKALNLLSTLVERGGHSDLRHYVVEAGAAIGFVPTEIERINPAISEIQHFFKGAGLKNNSDACTGASVRAGAGIRTRYQHGGWGSCWVNFRTLPRSIHVGTVSTVWYRMFGSMHQVKVTGQNYSRTVDFFTNGGEQGTKVHAGYANGVFDFSAPRSLVWYTRYNYSWHGTVLNFTPQRLQAGQVVEEGTTRQYRIQLYSPIVLDLVNTGIMPSLSAEQANVYFDHNGDGIKERTGWVSGTEGAILSLDLNENNKIDNGSELFGEGTLLSNGKKAKHGYEALAQYDSNKDGFITKDDAVFSKLKVWQDYNTDGISQKNEMKSLKEIGITKIATGFEKVAKDKSMVAGNVYKYQSKFWGPKQCSDKGCTSYDVFFSINSSLMTSNGK